MDDKAALSVLLLLLEKETDSFGLFSFCSPFSNLIPRFPVFLFLSFLIGFVQFGCYLQLCVHTDFQMDHDFGVLVWAV